jgi:hypothetical protein
MPWFKVDDGLHAHKKAVKAGVEAMGLWVMAGSWSSDTLTDGWVPDYVAARIDSNYKKHAAALVRAGLWVVDSHDGDDGWRFHDWESQQPSSESVRAKREDAKTRMQRVRENRKNGSQDVRANAERTSREVRSTPTRPEPVSTNDPSVASGGRHARETPPGGQAGPVEQILAEWIGGLKREPQRRIVDQVGEHVTAALRDGCPPDEVREAVAIWQGRGDLGPGALPSIIHEVTQRPPGGEPGTNVLPYRGRASPPPGARPSTTDQRVNEGLALAAKFRALEAEEAR